MMQATVQSPDRRARARLPRYSDRRSRSSIECTFAASAPPPPVPLHQGRVPGGVPALRLVRAPRQPIAPDRPHGPAARQRHRGAAPRARLARRSLRDRSRHARPALPRPRAARSRARPARARSPRPASMPAAIDAVVVSTCTGYLCPGLSGYVGERLGLRADVQSFDLVGQGCAAALPNLQLGRSLIASGTAKHVLSVCVEVSSAAMYLDDDPGVLISACLFGDGAGAAVLSAEPAAGGRRIEWHDAASLIEPAAAQGADVRAEGRHAAQHPDARGADARRRVRASCPRHRARPRRAASADIAAWIMHAGGRDVLLAVERRFELDRDALRHSAAMLREYGNLSSAFVYFVLAAALADDAPGGWWWLSSFGAGFSCHGALLRVRMMLARALEPETLDHLAPDDPARPAVAARPAPRQCVHGRAPNPRPRARSRADADADAAAAGRCESSRLGCRRRPADARRRAPSRRSLAGREVDLLDRQPIVERRRWPPTRRAAGARGRSSPTWSNGPPTAAGEPRWGVVVANLFLHHFEGDALRSMLAACARRADALRRVRAAAPPHRARGSHLIVFLGANAVTRHDARAQRSRRLQRRRARRGVARSRGRDMAARRVRRRPLQPLPRRTPTRRGHERTPLRRRHRRCRARRARRAAILLARAGWSVALVERQRFRAARCAANASPRATSPLLDALGVGAAVDSRAGADAAPRRAHARRRDGRRAAAARRRRLPLGPGARPRARSTRCSPTPPRAPARRACSRGPCSRSAAPRASSS